VRERLERAFSAAGMRAEHHCVFLNRMSQSQFVAAAGLCDVFLDSIGWSGCNSALECLPQALPIVTLDGATMRGRHSAAILRMIDVTDTIAATVEDYVAIATRLGQDTQFRQTMSSRMAENRHRLYGDRAPVTALENFLEGAVRG
jgi:predicted O-linked N-acetylglucosamine transferase (SPINDLY family)